MLAKNQPVCEDLFVAFARDWFSKIASGDWDAAFADLDLPPTSGERFTPESFRREVEVENFGEGTVFRKRFPAGIVYSDPELLGPSKYVELYPMRSPGMRGTGDLDAELRERLRNGGNVELQHPVPLNGEWSDLTACFQFVDRGAFYEVRLGWLHVQ